MCGIFSILNNFYHIDTVKKSFQKGSPRGPEMSTLNVDNDLNIIYGFHRLAINGFNNDNSNQPLKYKNCILICNGEIYNWKELHSILGITLDSRSDCEIIIHLYKKYGIEYTLQLLDGVFAFMLIDVEKKECFIARDCFGIRPLFSFKANNSISFSSVSKCFTDFNKYNIGVIEQFKPGTYSKYHFDNTWTCQIENKIFIKQNILTNNITIEESIKLIHDSLIEAVKKRVDNTERPICCLLSGGLDSSLITAIVKQNLKKNNTLHTWSIGFEGSQDLMYAQKVADYLHTIHHPIVLTEDEFLKAIPEVIEAVESYDTTTVRASVGNWLICKYIKEQSDAKVVFNGDGSDEVSGGYLYFHYAENCLDFDHECKRLLDDIHFFDVLRSDRSISSHGLEPRTPFLDKTFVQHYLSIPAKIRFDAHKKCEKYLIRTAFKGYLPEDVLFRTKEAFSDGVSSNKKPWFQVIQDFLKLNYTPKFDDKYYTRLVNPPKTLEQKYYRDIFEDKFPTNFSKTIPYFWMPKFVDATDASARTLGVYKTQ
tara:strand:+ start:2558 stop:4171 length:1614 start_codon:yes stop_codon:yes gene_type:complete